MDIAVVDHLSITNNGDRDKILSTVAFSVMAFTDHFPGALVYAEGSTLTRTRLYQMALGANMEEISKTLSVFGLLNGVWFYLKKM